MKIVNIDKKVIRMVQQINAAKASSEPKIEFGTEVLRNCKDAMRPDGLSSKTFWADGIKTESNQINAYSTFKDHKKTFDHLLGIKRF